MLLELEIRDFAIVQGAQVALGPGLCVLSGETGAGKSLVIDAIGALLGDRTTAESVRTGAEAARLRAVFDLTDAPGAAAQLDELGFEPDPDGLCIITREIRSGGRSRCTVNGSTATVAMLRQLGEGLIDIHGQHEHQSLMRVTEHVHILDATGGAPVAAAREAYLGVYRSWRGLLEEARRLQLDEGEKARRADLLRYQAGEIEAAALQPGEDEELRAQRGRLAHAERLMATAARAYACLEESDSGDAAVDRVAEALAAVEDMAQFDTDLAALSTQLGSALAVIEEAARTLGRYADQIEADPAQLDAVEERLDLIERLCRKYGETPEAVIAFGQRAAEELRGIEGADERLAELAAERERLEAELCRTGRALTCARAAAAERLTEGVESHLRDLNMQTVRFCVDVRPRTGSNETVEVDGVAVAPGPEGLDAVEFLLSANPGEPPRPLTRIASGGEISRVMLSLKSELAASDVVPTMIFDEIDVGIGGVTIRAVAQKMAAIAQNRQVIVVTHHAPIAALADTHIVVEKAPGEDATRVDVQQVEGEGRVYELARMLGRQPPTEATLMMARELLADVRS